MKDKTFVHFRSHLSYLAKHHGPAAPLYYLGMSARMGGATAKQVLRWMAGSGSADELRQRLVRQRQFMTLQHGRKGG
jgi:alkanesulfonate monooxygenase SsuD/methylene tetrahydromethanopterin reductase-like flavin-dependent oxidoreductase (luciferase family)